MSWLFALTGKKARHARNRRDLHDKPLFDLSLPGFYLAAGGIPETCFTRQGAGPAVGWAIVGLGIHGVGSQCKIMTSGDWEKLLENELIDTSSLNGHFAIIRWKADAIQCITDQVGLRSLYFSRDGDGLCISTRLDWVARAADHTSIDFHSLGASWLLFNQLSYDSCVVGVERIGPGGNLTFQTGSVSGQKSGLWLPSFTVDEQVNPLDPLTSFVDCAFSTQRTPSLGLSGGVDSRLLLSLMYSRFPSRFVAHTFGSQNDPDVKTAKALCKDLDVRLVHLDEPVPPPNECIAMVESYAAQTFLAEPISSVTKLRYYPLLHEQGKLMIDGGFGEIARRQYLNRIVKLGRKALASRDIGKLMQLMRTPRASIFSKDVSDALDSGARQSLEHTLKLLPAVEEIGVENFADLLALRTRIPNYGGPEQARLDSTVANFMPLVQPTYLRAVFRMPIHARANARFYTDTIKNSEPTLARHPLVKSGITYPFGLSTSMSWLLARIKARMGKRFSDPTPDAFLLQIRGYALDLAHSRSTRENPAYDQNRLLNAVTSYYNGDMTHRNTIDWWLTFELWRRSLSAPPQT